jgi:hypothetical protein
VNIFRAVPRETAPPVFAIGTNGRGIATPPQLSPGTYRIEAWTPDGAFAELDVSVPAGGTTAPETYPMALHASFAVQKAAAAAWATAAIFGKVLPPRDGLVLDQAGDPIPNAENAIWQVDPRRTFADERMSAADGTFSLPLPEGEYVAILGVSGFRRQVVRFEIAPQSLSERSDARLAVTLDVDQCP